MDVAIVLIFIGMAVLLNWLVLIKLLRLKKLIFIAAAVVAVVVVLFGTYKFSKSRVNQFLGHIYAQGETDKLVVALTFDDGPYEEPTDELMEILDAYDVKATFFLNGKDIDTFPDDTKKIMDAGHEIGNHGYSHSRLMLMSYNDVASEIEDTEKSLQSLGYETTPYIRTPYCKKLFAFGWYMMETERYNITWNIEPETYVTTKDEIVKHTMERLEPGAIILLHPWQEGRAETRAALPELIEMIRKEGYEFVTVSELIDPMIAE